MATGKAAAATETRQWHIIDAEGQVLGRIVRLLETGVNQVLVVTGDRERLIPFVSAVVVTVDLARVEMVVDWGLEF